MAKGKFSKARNQETPREPGRFSADSQEETMLLPDLHEEEDKTPSGGQMPEADFHNFSDSDLQDLIRDEFPELETIPGKKEIPDQEETPEAAPEAPEPPSEDQLIEETFAAEVQKEDRPLPPFLQKLHALWQGNRQVVLLSGGIAILVVALIFSGILLFERMSDPYGRRILQNVTVSGVNIGGMTKGEAEEALHAAVDPVLSGKDMVVKLPELTLTLSPADTHISLDAKAAVKAAYRYGRTGSKAEKEEAYRNSLTQSFALDPVPYLKVNTGYLKSQLKNYTSSFSSIFSPSSYALEGERPPLDIPSFNEQNTCQTLLLILGVPGSDLDTEKVISQILGAYGKLDMNLTIDMAQASTLPAPLDLDQIHQEYTIAPVDSAMDPKTFDVISGSYGYTFDLEEARKQLDSAKYGETLRIPMEYVEPDIMDEDVFFQDVLGTMETPHGNNANRNENLRIACETINGMVLHPGDEFSFNEALGQRTADKGYRPAPAYSGNVLVDSLGGGICQVSSTLYYSTLLADMKITDRINHGFLPTYIAPGLDATVSWGKPDFKFKNTSSFPIQIQAEATEDKVIVSILGTDDRDYYVKMEYEDSVSTPEETYKEMDPDSGYEDGEVISHGRDGHYVETFRCKYDKKTDKLISREFEARSRYPGEDTVIASVETPEPTEPPATEAPTAPPETRPETTEPPATQPPATEPPSTQAPADPPTAPPTDPPTAPPVTEAPAEDPEDTPADSAEP